MVIAAGNGINARETSANGMTMIFEHRRIMIKWTALSLTMCKKVVDSRDQET